MKKSTKLLTFCPPAVRSVFFLLLLAAFFATPAGAADSSLYTLESGLSNLVYRLSSSLVTVESFSSRKTPASPSGQRNAVRTVVASGLIVDTAGHILVAAESVINQDKVLVSFENQRIPARVVGVDYHEMVALLAVDRRMGRPVYFSDGHACAGQMVLAMGNAYGLRVSPSIGFCAGVRANGTMQFSIPVTSGAIGGGVFDLSGQLMGTITGRIGKSDQVVLATPSHRLRAAIDYMLVFGDRYAGFLGVSTTEIVIEPPLRTVPPNTMVGGARKPPSIIHAGLMVRTIYPSSPAAKAGLQVGDVIYAIGDLALHTSAAFSDLVRRLEPGMAVNVELIRRGEQYSVPLTVGRRELRHTIPLADGQADAEPDPQMLVDSLSRALDFFKKEVRRLERRLEDAD